jgi:hypothetical protein
LTGDVDRCSADRARNQSSRFKHDLRTWGNGCFKVYNSPASVILVLRFVVANAVLHFAKVNVDIDRMLPICSAIIRMERAL